MVESATKGPSAEGLGFDSVRLHQSQGDGRSLLYSFEIPGDVMSPVLIFDIVNRFLTSVGFVDGPLHTGFPRLAVWKTQCLRIFSGYRMVRRRWQCNIFSASNNF